MGPLPQGFRRRLARSFAAHRMDLAGCAVAYAVALGLRLQLSGTPPYGDEGLYYTLSQRPGSDVILLHYLYAPGSLTLHQFFFQRPLHYLLLAPGAQGTFESFRAWHALLTSFLPVATFLLLRAYNVRRAFAWGTAAATAALPLFVLWGAIAYPDGLATTATAFALWALARQHAKTLFAFALAAIWIKEAAAIPLALALLLEVARDARLRRRLWPLRLRRIETALVFALAAGPLPHLIALRLGAPFPGASRPSETAAVLDGLLLTTWFIPLLLVGVFRRRSRFLATLALAVSGTYMGLHLLLDQAVEVWYTVATSHLAIAGVALTLDDLWPRSSTSFGRRAGHATLVAVVAFLVVAAVALPTGTAKGRLLKPLSGLSDNALADMIRYEHGREGPFLEALPWLDASPDRTVFVVDVYLPFVLYPTANGGAHVWTGWTSHVLTFDLPLRAWSNAIEERANRTLIERHANPLNEALVETYRDCVVFENPAYFVIEGAPCIGRAPQLEAAYYGRRPPSWA